eukprot:2387893-Lingulodinium_polyedra.AAC.1
MPRWLQTGKPKPPCTKPSLHEFGPGGPLLASPPLLSSSMRPQDAQVLHRAAALATCPLSGT